MTRAMQYRIFWLNLANLVDAGMPLIRTFDIISRQASGQDRFDLGIKKIAKDIRQGWTFSEAMKRSELFSNNEINIVRAGELGGMLEIVLKRLANDRLPTRASQYEDFYQTLSQLIASGVPILQSLKLSSQNLDEPLKLAVEKIHDSVKAGDSMSAAMAENDEFSELEVNLIEIGEESGSLDSMLLHLAMMNRSLKFE